MLEPRQVPLARRGLQFSVGQANTHASAPTTGTGNSRSYLTYEPSPVDKLNLRCEPYAISIVSPTTKRTNDQDRVLYREFCRPRTTHPLGCA